MAEKEKKKKDIIEGTDGKKMAALEARVEGLNEQLEEAKAAAEDARGPANILTLQSPCVKMNAYFISRNRWRSPQRLFSL